MFMSILTVSLNPCIDRTVEINGFLYGGLNSVVSARSDPGGKGINVSRVLKKSGEDTFCTGVIATDGGDYIKDALTKEEIGFGFAKCPGKLRTNMKLFDSESRITTEINEPGFCVSENTVEEFIGLFNSQLSKADVVVLSGSVAGGMPSDIYKTLIEKASALGIKTVLDASGRLFRLGVEAVPFAVKPNIHELEEYTGTKLTNDSEIKKAAEELLKKGISRVCVSMGAEGALFASREGFIRTFPFEGEIKSTVGAGDSMVAAIAFALKNGMSFEETAKLATSAGTLTACLEGTDLCSLKDAKKLCEKVKVSEGDYI